MKWLTSLFSSVVFQTVIAGVFIFVIKELIGEFILSPIKKYNEVIGKIDNRMKYYANVITNSGISVESVLESSKVMRELSCELESTYKQISLKRILSLVKIIPAHKFISESAGRLIRVSNAGGQAGNEAMNYEEIVEIRKNLNIIEI